MHRLVRKVRFSVDPFTDNSSLGANSYASRPCAQGVALFFELTVGLVGEAKENTGFVLNVKDVDDAVREFAVPIFDQYISGRYKLAESITIPELAALLAGACANLKDKFTGARLIDLSLALDPYRKIAFDCEDFKMFYYSEKFEFAAMHKLWNDKLTEEQNFAAFGKCANPNGHGHNYILEITVKAATDTDIQVGKLEQTVNDYFIELLDHKNINADVKELAGINPTIENIAAFAWDKLADKFDSAKLHSVSVAESDRTYCTYYG